MSQTIEDLKQQQNIDDAKTAALNAQTARVKAEKNLAEAQESDAASAALKSKFEVPGSGYAGDTKVGSKAGGIESSLLAARALTLGSAKIAAKLKPILDNSIGNKAPAPPILLYAYGETPTFQTFVAYKTQYTIVQKAIQSALGGLDAANKIAPSLIKEAVVTPQIAGMALDSVNKLLGFFRTDYTVEGVEVKFDDNVPLLNALAGELSGNNYKYDVRTPALYTPPVDLATDPIFVEITALANQYTTLREAVAASEAKLAVATAGAAKTGIPDADKKQLEQSAAALKEAIDFAKAAETLYDTFYAKLVSGDDKNAFSLNTILQQSSVRNLLREGSPLLIVKIDKAGGTYYTRKNLWTSIFGGMPFFNMGGVVITYSLLDGNTGRVLASDTVPIDGGFVKISKLPAELSK